MEFFKNILSQHLNNVERALGWEATEMFEKGGRKWKWGVPT
jgi:hypothetical protein